PAKPNRCGSIAARTTDGEWARRSLTNGRAKNVARLRIEPQSQFDFRQPILRTGLGCLDHVLKRVGFLGVVSPSAVLEVLLRFLVAEKPLHRLLPRKSI